MHLLQSYSFSARDSYYLHLFIFSIAEFLSILVRFSGLFGLRTLSSNLFAVELFKCLKFTVRFLSLEALFQFCSSFRKANLSILRGQLFSLLFSLGFLQFQNVFIRGLLNLFLIFIFCHLFEVLPVQEFEP